MPTNTTEQKTRTTCVALKAWWLKRAMGYRVERIHYVAKKRRIRGEGFVTCWVLAKGGPTDTPNFPE